MLCVSCVRVIKQDEEYFTSTLNGKRYDYHLKCKPLFYYGRERNAVVPDSHDEQAEGGQLDLFSDGPPIHVRDGPGPE